MCLDVQNHLGDGGRSKTNVSNGQDGEEEVHGGVEAGVRADRQDDEQILQHGDQVMVTRRAQKLEAAALDLLRVPGGEISRHLLCSVAPHSRDTFWKINEDWYKGNK